LIGWGLLKVNHSSGVREKIFWVSFGWVKGDTLTGVESSSKVITAHDSENSLIYIEVDSNVKILPCVVLRLIFWEWKLMSLQEGTLWNTGVLNLWFIDVDSVII
jgi:hypothetical protein